MWTLILIGFIVLLIVGAFGFGWFAKGKWGTKVSEVASKV